MNPKNKIIFSQDQINNIIDLYINSNYSASMIGKKYKVSESKILTTLHENKVKLRVCTKKYKLNENIFENIDNKQSSYFLGMFCADGGIQSKNNCAINLQEQDVDVLKYLKSILNTKKPLYFNNIKKKNKNWQNSYTLSIRSKKIINDLNKLGVTPNKTFNLEFPKIPLSQYKSFILGYFDGDGSLSYQKNKKDFIVQICGTKPLLEKYKNIIQSNLAIKVKIYTHGSIYKLVILGNRQSYMFMDWLYKNEPFKMERKYCRFLELQQRIIAIDKIHGLKYNKNKNRS